MGVWVCGGEEYSFVSRLGGMAIDHAFFSRRSRGQGLISKKYLLLGAS